MLTFMIVAACLLPLQGIFAEKASCTSPPPLADHATLQIRERHHGIGLYYRCHRFYYKFKSSNVTCLDGQWVGTTPICKDSRCHINYSNFPGIEELQHGNYYNGTILVPQCRERFKLLDEDNKIICINGEWMGPAFPCIGGKPIISVTTEPPESFEFSPSGALLVRPHVDIHIMCHSEHTDEMIRLRGPRKEVKPTYDYKMINGKHIWTGLLRLIRVTPRDSGIYVCTTTHYIRRQIHIEIEEIVLCPQLNETEGLTITYTDERKLNSSAMFHCAEPYKRTGVAFVTCTPDGEWSESSASCVGDHKPPVPDQEPNDAKSVNTLRPQQLGTTNAGDLVNLERSTQPVSKNPDVISTPEPLDIRNPNNCFCTYNNLDSNVAAYSGQRRLEFGERVKKDSIVQFNCKIIGYYRLKGPSELSCENCDWHWSEFPTCVPPARGEPIILMNTEPPGSFAFSPSGTLYVKPHVDVNITCHLQNANEEILLSGPQKEVKPAYEYIIVKGRHIWTGILMLTQVMPRDSGMYICSRKNDSSISHQVHIKIEGDCVVMALPNGRFEFKTLKPRGIIYGRGNVAVFELVHLNTQHSNGTVLYVSCTSPYIFNGKGNASHTPVQCDRGRWRPQPSCLLASDQKQPPCVDPMTSLQTSRPVTKVPVVTSTVSAKTENLNKPKAFTRPSNFDDCTINKELGDANLEIFPVKEVYKFGEIVKFMCSPRHKLTPKIEQAVCLPSGWSNDFPHCTPLIRGAG